MRMAPSATPARPINRNLVIVSSVVLLHVAALWALQTGLLRRAVEIVVPVAILSEMVAPPAPKVEPPSPPAPPAPARPAPVRKAQPVAPVQPRTTPLAVAEPSPAATQPMNAPAAAIPAPAVASNTPVSAAPSVPAPARIQLPTSHAAYLNNPAPVYPPISKRLGEQGKVIVRVMIGEDGLPKKAELKVSSGSDRLDRSALDYVMKCRYVPGKVGDVPTAMWHEAPVSFVLE